MIDGAKNRPIDSDSGSNRGVFRLSKFSFEIKGADFRWIAESVLRGAQKKFAAKNQRVPMTQNNRVGVRERTG